MRRLILLSFLMLFGQQTVLSAEISLKKDFSVNSPSEIHARLAFTCKHETIPEASLDTDVLFKYARWLQKNNQLKQDKAVDAEIERLYRIAAENGHYKASINLQNGSLRGQFSLSSHERLRLSQRLTDAGVATGYYFIAIYLENGTAGLKQDPELALRYYRKAADEGNSLAQSYVGEKLFMAGSAYDVAEQMRRCAAEQGIGDAASNLGVSLQGKSHYQEALEAFQLGVAAGDESSASFLEHGFSGPEPTNRLYYLAQQPDPERARRYEQIGDVLGRYSYASPVVPEINDIVPLPPALLPAWDGKLKWLEEREANVPPPKPSEALIAELAKAKQLNPTTGKPLPQSPDFDKTAAVKLLCRSGEPCPKSGYWQIAWIPNSGISKEETRYFKQGDIMPTDRVERFTPRPWPLKDKRVTEEQWVDWRFIGEA